MKPSETILSVHNVESMLSQAAKKPFITLLVANEEVTFLCDSVAGSTVLIARDAPSEIKTTPETITILSASGHSVHEHLTERSCIVDAVTGLSARLRMVLSKCCPVSLLGRDAMRKLKIGIRPTATGMEAYRLTEQAETFVLEDASDVHYCYGINPVISGPTSVTAALKQLAVNVTKPNNHIKVEHDMQISSCCSLTQGPDTKHETMLFREKCYKLTITSLCWDEFGNVGAAVIGRDKFKNICILTPHIALAKIPDMVWEDIESFVFQGEQTAVKLAAV